MTWSAFGLDGQYEAPLATYCANRATNVQILCSEPEVNDSAKRSLYFFNLLDTQI